MSDTIKKLLLCTSGMVLCVALTTLGAWLMCNPWPCEDAKNVLPVPFILMAMVVGLASLAGYITTIVEWWENLGE
jgi:uncharacterized membrane protein